MKKTNARKMSEIINMKGITLIALVITIIVLLILAGISISMLAGNNSILQKATEAKTNEEIAKIEETLNLKYISMLIDNSRKNNDLNLSQFISIIQEQEYENQILTYEEQSISGIKIIEDSEEITPFQIRVKANETKQYSIEIERDNSSIINKYYILLNGRYHYITLENNKIKLSEQEVENPVQTNITALSDNKNVIDASVNGTTLTLTGGLNNGIANISIKVNGIEYKKMALTTKGITLDQIANASQSELQSIMGSFVVNYLPAGNDIIGKTREETSALSTEEKNQIDMKKWRILYVDRDNIYLIASEYITEVPATNRASLTKNSNNKFEFKINSTEGYNGSEDITDERLKKLNQKLFDGLGSSKSESRAMKMVAYLMDTEIWGQEGMFYDSNYADYAIGGPTIELLFNAYNKKFGLVAGKDTNALCYEIIQSISEKRPYSYYIYEEEGYAIRDNIDSNWKTSLNFNNTVFSKQPEYKGCLIASPSCAKVNTNYTSYLQNNLYADYYAGKSGQYIAEESMRSGNYYNIRPVICVNSSVCLEESEFGWKLVRIDE